MLRIIELQRDQDLSHDFSSWQDSHTLQLVSFIRIYIFFPGAVDKLRYSGLGSDKSKIDFVVHFSQGKSFMDCAYFVLLFESQGACTARLDIQMKLHQFPQYHRNQGLSGYPSG